MCKMLLRDIAQEQQDKYKIAQRLGKTCGNCADFSEDEAFDIIGVCKIKGTHVSRYQFCTAKG